MTPIIILLDFDGTLTPIARSPNQARLLAKTRNILRQLSQKPKFYIGILSGRKLEDLKEKIRLPNIIYGACHGLEGEIFDKRYSFPIPKEMFQAIKNIQKQLKFLAEKQKGILIEDKDLVVSFHFRLADKRKLPEIKSQFNQIIKPYLSRGLVLVLKGKMVFDIYPKVKWNKGYFANMVIEKIRNQIRTKPMVIFIGDDITDEDIFRKLKNGITIKVGKNMKSKASFYLKNTKDVIEFLNWINNSV